MTLNCSEMFDPIVVGIFSIAMIMNGKPVIHLLS